MSFGKLLTGEIEEELLTVELLTVSFEEELDVQVEQTVEAVLQPAVPNNWLAG